MTVVTVVAVVAEVTVVGDFHRFDNPRQLMACLGLTPSAFQRGQCAPGRDHKGGQRPRQARVARRALIEGAWSDRMRPRVSVKLLAQLAALPRMVRDIAWKGPLRMCQRHCHLVAAGRAKVVAVTAIAREMPGFVRAIARAVTTPTAAPVAKAL